MPTPNRPRINVSFGRPFSGAGQRPSSNPFSAGPGNPRGPAGPGNPAGPGGPNRPGSPGDADNPGDPSPAWPPSFNPFLNLIGVVGNLRRLLIIAAIAMVPLLLALYWWFHPSINLRSLDTWNFIIFFILIPTWFFCQARSALAQREAGTPPNRAPELDEAGRIKTANKAADSTKKAESRAQLWRRLSWLPVAVFAAFLVGWLLSSPIFPGNARRFASIIQVETRDFTEDIQAINYSEIPVIDRESASLIGNRVMGEIPEYVSQFYISPLYSQINYQARPVRVSPLEYADIFKWFNNRSGGLPGYVLVDTASQDARIVRLADKMLYSQSEPLGRNIDRHVQLKYPFYMFDQKSFEIDEDGKPWWICPVQTRRVGLFGGTDITRVVLCDATSGECIDLPVADCPTWVDRLYPAELVLEQYNWRGAYSQGWLNSWLGQAGVVRTTPGTYGQLGYNYIAKDDDVWVYTGITSATSDSSIVGFVLVNSRTAEARFYPISGATEDSAMYSAQGQVQHLGYRATFPLLANINGQPTYFMALKDNAGLVKMYAMLDIQRYQNVAVGDTVASCQAAYYDLLVTNGVIAEGDGDHLDYGDENEGPGLGSGSSGLGVPQTAEGTVARVATAVIGGNSHFYLTLEGDPNIYDCALPDLLDVLMVEPGTRVRLTYRQDDQTRVVQRIELLE